MFLEEPLPEEEECYLWPENVPVFVLWMSLQTQWDFVEGCKVGLKYPGVQVCIDNMDGLAPEDKPAVFHAIQAMETAVLSEWKSKR